MLEKTFVTETRQKADLLFGPVPSSDLLGVGATLALPARTVSGYASVALLGVSDQAFQLRVEEANVEANPVWVETSLVASALDPSTGMQFATLTAIPAGLLMRVFVDNLGGGQGLLEVNGNGLPL